MIERAHEGFKFGTLVGVFIFGLVLGVNWARYTEGFGVIWEEGMGGLNSLKENLKNDNTRRIALVVVTEKNAYQILSVSNVYVDVELREIQ